MTIQFEDLYHKYEVPFFDQIKDSILFDIEKWPRFSVVTQGQDIYNTDFFLQPSQRVPWGDALKNMLNEHAIWYKQQADNPEVGVEIDFSDLVVQSLWFQQYRGIAAHDWHAHAGAEMTNILYVQLPNDVPATTEVYVGGKVFDIEAEVGEVVTFPACYHHRSKMFESDEMKTVVAWNTGIRFA